MEILRKAGGIEAQKEWEKGSKVGGKELEEYGGSKEEKEERTRRRTSKSRNQHRS